MIDLHVHTTMSDGQHSPEAVVAMAAQQGISTIAVTDHDTVAGIGAGERTAARLGLEFVPGIEISVKGARELHILGYWIDPGNGPLAEMCGAFARRRREREARILAFLADRGVHLTPGQVRRQVTHELVGRPHFARAMVEAGYAASVQEAFDRYLSTPDFQRIERPKPTPGEGIRMIRGAGGVAVLAHPVTLKLEGQPLEGLLRELIGEGLQGMECYYSRHTPEQTAGFLALARANRLLVTAGSDFHGEKMRPGVGLGIACDGRERGIVAQLRGARGEGRA